MMTSSFYPAFYQRLSEHVQSKSEGKLREISGSHGDCHNFLLTLIKMVAGILFNSIAMTADAVNNLTDSASSVVTLVGFKLSSKPADKKHPYGHARIEYIQD